MGKAKTISEIVFPIIKEQFITCSKNKCTGCYENSKGSCSSALTSNEIEVALVNEGYGNVKQAVKEFAEKLKAEINDIPKTALSFSLRHDAPTLIDLVYKELYGADE